MHQALYRKWRPKVFDDVCGQEHITSILKYETENSKWSHAYLFCGSRGTGKTTCAKILSKAVNCEHPVNGNPCGVCPSCLAIESGAGTDVLEMDAASNNGVDNIRDIRDEVAYAPSMLKYRVYIIDEVHMLSTSAFNALLKTLEEPPAHVIFVLATTELQKLPATIISRCQRFDFRRIGLREITDRLMYISENENIEIDRDAAMLIAKQAQGGMRDAINLLDLCAGARRRIDISLVNETVGSSGRECMVDLVSAILERDYECIFKTVSETVASSKDLAVFWQELISLYRDLLVINSTDNYKEYLDLTDSECESLAKISKRFTRQKLLYHCTLLDSALSSMMRANAIKRITAELTLMRMCDEELDSSGEALLSRITELEHRLASGEITFSQSVNVSSKTEEAPKKAEVTVTKNEAKPETKENSSVPPDNEAEAEIKSEAKLPDQAPKDTDKQKQSSNEKRLRRIECYAEAVDKYSDLDPMTAPFLNDSVGVYDKDGKVTILYKNDYLPEMMRISGTAGVFATTLSRLLKVDLKKEDIRFEYRPDAKMDNDSIDEIINNLN